MATSDSVVTFNYTQGFKRAIVSSLKPLFSQPEFPIDDLRNHVYVGLEYPLTDVLFPAIYITFQEQQLRSVGVGHTEELTAEDGAPIRYKHWMFTGSVNFNIMALSPTERDQLSSILINILAFGDMNGWLNQFQQSVFTSSYIYLQYLKEIIHPMGETIGSVPWDSETEMIFSTNYAIDVLGEFYSNIYTGDLIEVEHVDIFPYREGDQPHW